MGERISLSQVDGFLVGHAQDSSARTGCTAILTLGGAVASAFTPGFAPGSRETELLRPDSSPREIHGLLLTGGSAFGLGAASGVVRFLRERGVGLDTGHLRVPLVPAAVIYDYPGNASAGLLPDGEMGYQAAAAASRKALRSGPFGAGLSAASGKLAGPELASPSGIGSFGMTDGTLQLAALVVANPLGSIVRPDSGRILSGLRRPDGSLATRGEILALLRDSSGQISDSGHTVLAVVGTNAVLDKLEAYRVSRMAAAGIARAVFPAHLLYDGDTVFVLSTGVGPRVAENWLGALAAEAVSRAIVAAALAGKRQARKGGI
jgi:L-aminopeptidase/D-esterase-like protein